MNDNNSKQLGDQKALSKLKNRGGKGQEGIGIIGGSVLTIKETIATTIAKDVIDDAERGTGKKLKDLSMIEIAPYAQYRSKGRAVSDASILAEIARLQNHAIYGDTLARR